MLFLNQKSWIRHFTGFVFGQIRFCKKNGFQVSLVLITYFLLIPLQIYAQNERATSLGTVQVPIHGENGSFMHNIEPSDPNYDKIRSSRNFLHYEYMGMKEGMNMWRDKDSGVIFADLKDHTHTPRGSPDLFIFEDGKIKRIRSTNPRYRQIAGINAMFERNRRAWHLRNNRQETRRGRSVLRRFGWLGKLFGVGGIFIAVFKDKRVEANELSEAVVDSIGESMGEVALSNSDLPSSEYLSNLKRSAERISRGNYPLFSEHRQGITRQLNEVYTEISSDSSLEQQEKERLLAQVNEIKLIVQPSSPPRNPPRNRRTRFRASSGDQ